MEFPTFAVWYFRDDKALTSFFKYLVFVLKIQFSLVTELACTLPHTLNMVT